MCHGNTLLSALVVLVHTGRCVGNITASSMTEKGNALLRSSASNSSAPFYFKELGTQGVNFDVDKNGKPYIWCEKFSVDNCPSLSEEECTKKVKCFAERRSHHLGCMAVMMYNASVPYENITLTDTAPTLKGCWSQDASELRECVGEEECVASTRKTGAEDRAAMFCCCRTHNCNHNFTFRPLELDEEPTPDQPSRFNILIVVLILSVLIALCGIVYWGVRNHRRKFKLDNKMPPNGLSLGSIEYGHESTALLGNKTENLRSMTLLEKTSTGRFSEVFKGQLGANLFAVKIFPASDLDSWVTEQDVYALKAVRSHPNVVDFVAAFQNNDKYWLVTVYHKNGSLCDYLKENVLSLEASTKIISTMLEGLAFLHEETIVGEESKPSVVHRDFKSKNVLIKDDLTTCITDFGLALKCENGRMSEDSHGQVGTPRYMAPEMLEGATEFSAFAFQQIDVYAAGLVVWEVLSRTRVPEDAENAIPDYLLPYEKEAGPSPSLGLIREIVVIRKSRPEVREAQLQNKSSRTIVKTIREMWDKEPDGRITSARARDRMARLYESLQSGTASSASREEVENDGCDLSP